MCSAVPDRQYEVKVWAYNKQTDGYPAVWKGRTEKAHTRGEKSVNPPLCGGVCLYACRCVCVCRRVGVCVCVCRRVGV